MLQVSHSLTGKQFTEFQKRVERHVAFSLTQACPLQCRHCIVDTVSPRQMQTATISDEQAQVYAGQMPALRRLGIDRISFTGGEPLLALHPLSILSSAAALSDIQCTVVTACHWAGSVKSARRTLAEFPYIDHWHLSADRFHQEYLPVGNVVRAAEAALDVGREVVVRMAAQLPVHPDDERFYEELRSMLPSRASIAVQQINHAGRGKYIQIDLPVNKRRYAPPCISTGMVVRSDGSISPCCSSLIDIRSGHPFLYQPATEVGLAQSYTSWRNDPLLQLIRAIGFTPVLDWIQSELPDHPLLFELPDHPCEVCTRLWAYEGTSEIVMKHIRLGQVKEKIEALYQMIFNQTISVG
ncbi:MAG: radical SAM protein [Nitrospira sp.]|nr:radical SAM protein [Nitrospira sp.]